MKTFKQFTASANRKKEDEPEELFEMPIKKKLEPLANDLEPIQDEIDKNMKIRLNDGEWEIESVVDISTNAPEINEAIIVNADLGNTDVSRGDVIYVTAMLRKKDAKFYSQNVMGVFKCRIVDIYNSLSVLNGLK